MACNQLFIVFMELEVGHQRFCELASSQLSGDKISEKLYSFLGRISLQPLAVYRWIHLQRLNQKDSRDKRAKWRRKRCDK